MILIGLTDRKESIGDLPSFDGAQYAIDEIVRRRTHNPCNDISVKLFPQLSDGLIAVCKLPGEK